MSKDKLTLDLEKIKEVYNFKEGCKYVIYAETDREGCAALAHKIKKITKADVIVINSPIQIYEVKQ